MGLYRFVLKRLQHPHQCNFLVMIQTVEYNYGNVRVGQWVKLQKQCKSPPSIHVALSIVGSLCDREVACSASDRQGSNFESCIWRTVSSHSSHHPQEVVLAQFSLYVHKCGLKPDSFHFIAIHVAYDMFCLFDDSFIVHARHLVIKPELLHHRNGERKRFTTRKNYPVLLGPLYIIPLTITTLKYLCIKHGDQRVFSILKSP